jgi:hypothetical protein
LGLLHLNGLAFLLDLLHELLAKLLKAHGLVLEIVAFHLSLLATQPRTFPIF